MKVLERAFEVVVARPVLAIFDLPVRRAERGNLNKMPYTAHDIVRNDMPSLGERMTARRQKGELTVGFIARWAVLSTLRTLRTWLSPLRFLSRVLGKALEEREKRALSLIPEILGADVATVHVVDCGAAGTYHAIWNHFAQKITIHMFEPEEKAFEALCRDFRDEPRLRIYNTLLASKAGPLTLNLYLWPRASSIYRPNQAFVEQTYLRRHYEVVSQVTFPARPLADVLNATDLSFLKADVEGAEMEILRGADRLLDGCVGLELELWYSRNVFDDVPLASDVIAFCQERGFTLVTVNTPRLWHYGLPHPEMESRGFVGQGDTLFVRVPHAVVDLVLSGQWPRQKLAVAACIYLAYGHYEFAYKLIELAMAAGLLRPTDRVAVTTIEAVRRFSGRDRLVTYRTLKGWLHRVNGVDPYRTLW